MGFGPDVSLPETEIVTYRNTITDFLWPLVDDTDIENVRFPQDGATCYSSRKTIIIDWPRERFPERLIQIRGEQVDAIDEHM